MSHRARQPNTYPDPTREPLQSTDNARHRSKRRKADEQLHRLGDVDRNVPPNAHCASAGSAGRHVEAIDHVDVLDGLVAGDVVLAVGDVESPVP